MDPPRQRRGAARTQAPGWSQGLNPYSYAFNNPTRYVDPSGFDGEDIGGDDGADPYMGTPYETANAWSDSESLTDPLAAAPVGMGSQGPNLASGMEEFSPEAGLQDPGGGPSVANVSPYTPTPIPPSLARDTSRYLAQSEPGSEDDETGESSKSDPQRSGYERQLEEAKEESDAVPFRIGPPPPEARDPLSVPVRIIDPNASEAVGPNGYRLCTEAPLRLYENQLPERLAAETEAADNAGVRIISGTGPEFDVVINQGTIKFIVTPSAELRIAPHTFNGIEVSHAFLSGGQPVLAAGQAEIAGAAGTYFGVSISNHSGHFTPSEESLSIAQTLWLSWGVQFP